MDDVKIITYRGKEILPHLDAAAALRIEVFRDYPYLYDGTREYEAEYLATYAACKDAIFVLAIYEDRVIGVSTGLPMIEADEAFQKPFLDAGIDIAKMFYHGESCLQTGFRGRGIGHAFFDHREQHARHLGCEEAVFCAVERPDNHPLCPLNYRSNEAFWRKRGYQSTSYIAQLEWLQHDSSTPVNNRLRFWKNIL